MVTGTTKNQTKLLQRALQHLQAGQLQQAEQLYQQVLAKKPNNAEANHFLGVIACQAGKFEAGARFIRKAVKAKPGYAEAHKSLGKALQEMGQLEEAAAGFRQALSLRPNYPEALNDLGNTLNDLEQFDEAISCFRKAIAQRPDFFIAYNNLGNVLQEHGDLDEAVACFRNAITLKPNFALFHYNLGNALKKKELYVEAIASYQKAIAIQPNYPEALNNIGITCKEMERLDEARIFFQKALGHKPDYSFAHSNLLTLMNYLSDVSQQDIFAEALQWDIRQARSLLPTSQVFSNTPERNRKLRIGYVSPDFRDHSVAYFIEPVIKAHNRDTVEVFCYANVVKQDKVTERFQALSDHWSFIAGKNDDAVADEIRGDRIDILVDLAGHTRDNSLMVFARKPAPVQVTWLGYPNTTGMRAIDYRFTDAIADPVGDTDNLHSEILVRLANGFLCYQPDETAPATAEPPCLKNGYITFGSFNNLNKLTPEVVQCWATILKKLPGSHLLLKSKKLLQNASRQRFIRLFNENGITEERLKLYGILPKKEDHLNLYSMVDIGLDPFPYNGTTTTCEALWMGVPVVTLLGDRHAGRVGASILHHISLNEFIAENKEEYLNKSLTLAKDLERLCALRDEMRIRILNSPICNTKAFVKDIEEAYSNMWKKYVLHKTH